MPSTNAYLVNNCLASSCVLQISAAAETETKKKRKTRRILLASRFQETFEEETLPFLWEGGGGFFARKRGIN